MRLDASSMMHRLLFLVVAYLSFYGSPAHASTWTVATDGHGLFTSIQEGINAAAAGDTVIVGPGIYVENLQFLGRDIVVRSAAGPDKTTIDGSTAPLSVVQIRNGESNATVLSGFTLTGGAGVSDTPAGWSGGGGGILILNAEPTISGNVIIGNSADRTGDVVVFGGGVFCLGTESREWHPMIVGNRIDSNTSAWNGGGVGAVNAMAPTITGNLIRGNSATVGDGGGIWIWNRGGAFMEVSRNTVTSNTAGDHGGGIYLSSFNPPASEFVVTSNICDENRAFGLGLAESSGGGLWIGHITGIIANNTIVRSRGADFLQGGALTIVAGVNLEVHHNILALTTVGEGIVCIESQVNIHDNLAWMNFDGQGRGNCRNWELANGNVVDDPMFCNVDARDFSVANTSPALSHEGGPIGAVLEYGCVRVPVRPTTWGSIKAMYARE